MGLRAYGESALRSYTTTYPVSFMFRLNLGFPRDTGGKGMSGEERGTDGLTIYVEQERDGCKSQTKECKYPIPFSAPIYRQGILTRDATKLTIQPILILGYRTLLDTLIPPSPKSHI